MSDNKVKLGDGVADGLKSEANQEILSIGKMLIGVLSKYVKDKVQNIDLEKLLSKKDTDELISLWSSQLAEKGVLPKGYAGLPDNLLIDNLHQDGYLEGIYVGYALAIMSLVDNNAPEELILAVRDDVRPNLMGHHYNDREEFFLRYKGEAYSWVERSHKND